MSIITLTEGVDTIEKVFNSEIVKEDAKSTDILKATILPNVDINTGDTVNYFNEANELIFSGICWTVNNEALKEIVVYDLSAQLINRIVNNVFRDKSPEFIIEDIVNTFSTLTFVSTVSTGVTISKVVFKEKTALDAIKDMLALFNGNIRVDELGNFFLELRQETFASVTITEGIETNLTGWTTNTDKLATKVTLIGDKILSKTSETFVSTGTSVVLLRQPIDVQVLIGATELVQTIDGIIDGDYIVDIQNNTITFDVSQTDPVVNYSYESQIKVTAQAEPALITKFGLVEKKIEKKYIETMSEARAFVRTYLSIFSDGIQGATFSTKTLDLSLYNPNSSIRVVDNVRTPVVDDEFIIKKSVRKFGGAGGVVEVTVGEGEEEFLDWQKETVERIKQLEEQNDNSDFVQLYEIINNNVQVSVEVEIVKENIRTYFSDTFYLEEGNVVNQNRMTEGSDGDVMRENGFTSEPAGISPRITTTGDTRVTTTGDRRIIS